MGHVRQGRLPRTRRWKQVIELLGLSSPDDVATVASATNHAADQRLRELSDDPSLGYCFWLLTRIAWASRDPDFRASVGELGIQIEDDDSVFSFIARLSGHVRSELGPYTESGVFSELAALSMRCALTETVGQAGRSLFGSSLDDLRAAFRRHSTPVRFAGLARSFFGDFLARTLHFFIGKELPNVIGAGSRLPNVDASRDFTAALDLHARQSARIMETFARDWYSKHNWEAMGQISRDEADRFTAHALEKLRSEINRPETAGTAS